MMTEIVSPRRAIVWPGACVVALALLTSGCASNSSKPAGSNDQFEPYDTDNNNNISGAEWDKAYHDMDTNGDGTVSRDEYNAAVSKSGGGGKR